VCVFGLFLWLSSLAFLLPVSLCLHPAPEINLIGGGVSIVTGDADPQAADGTDFGTVSSVNPNTAQNEFTIENTGDAALGLLGAPLVAISGTDVADFLVSTQPAATVAAMGGQQTFVVRFNPNSGGTAERTAVVTIFSHDEDETEYTFAIKGTATGMSL
jgi:hypothetical protein